MRFQRWVNCLILCAAVHLAAAPAHAAFHLWRIQEVFTNANGSVQFVEMFCPSGPFNDNEHVVGSQTLRATSDGAIVDFVIPGNLDTEIPTSGQTFLLATSGYFSLAGAVQPDFTLPTNFINPNAASITLRFAGGVDTLTFAGSLLPKNGTQSLVDNNPAGTASLVTAGNTPKNFAGQTGSINAAPPLASADFNSSGAVNAADLELWRTGFGKDTAAVRVDGNADADGDVDGNDFLIWQRQVTTPNAAGGSTPSVSAVPEPGTAGMALVALAALTGTRLKRKRPVERGSAGRVGRSASSGVYCCTGGSGAAASWSLASK
jgi:hypothetical protein